MQRLVQIGIRTMMNVLGPMTNPAGATRQVIGVFSAGSCTLLGNYLVLRGVSLMGDAIAHAVLPGIAVGILISVLFVAQWLAGEPMRVRPLMLFGVGLVILGVQFVSIGLLGELIARDRAARPVPIRERLG